MYRFLLQAAFLVAGPLLAAGAELSERSTGSPSGVRSGSVTAPATNLRPLSTDRPDQTESPQTVDAGHWQIEADLVVHTRDRDRTGGGEVVTRDLSVGSINLKYGLTGRVDVQLMVDPYVESRVEDRLADTTARASGFGDVTTRLKVNLWGNDGGPTACAVMPFIKWPLSASGIRNGETEGGVIFILGYELPAGWGSAVMTEVDWVDDGTGGRDVEWINSITFAHDLTSRLGGYVELFTVTSNAPGFKWQVQFDAGLTYAVTENIQLDIGCNFGLTRAAPDYQPFVGFSRRF